MSDVAVVLCPNCMQKYRVPEKMIGRRAVCKQCGERFKVSRPAELDEDTVVGWVSAEDPTGTSVMGSSSIFSAPTGDESAARRRWRRPPPPAEPRIHFVRVDRHGAWFEFEAVMLELPALRGSFPHRCVHCLNPKYLNLHYVLWGDKLPPRDRLRLEQDERHVVRNLDQRMERDGERWLDELDPVVELPRPFCHPMPYCVCKECTSIGELGTEVFERNGMEWCRITIANLTIAIDFFRNNGGRGDPGYQRLLVARQQQSDNQWQNLPYAIRERISEWFTRQGGEKFLGFFPDVDFAKAETGIAGLVLTDQRMVYKKYACCREFALRAGGRIDVEATRSRAVVSIRQDGKDDADLNTKPLQAGSLARTLTDLSPLWAIRVEARE